MTESKSGFTLIILLSIVFAMIASILPLPFSVQAFRPNWLFLVLFFWLLIVPGSINIYWVCAIGLLSDLLLAEPLGLNAFCFICVAFLMSRIPIRMSTIPFWQQFILLLLLNFLYLSVKSALLFFSGLPCLWWQNFIVVLLNCVVWPWVYSVLNSFWKKRTTVY